MGKHFSELSDEARSAIVDAVLDIDVPNLSESAKDEIRDWATQEVPDHLLCENPCCDALHHQNENSNLPCPWKAG